MAICTQCGALLHSDDVEQHICDWNDIPTKNNPKRAQFRVI